MLNDLAFENFTNITYVLPEEDKLNEDNDVAGSSIATKIARTIKFGTAVTAILGNLLLLIVFSQRKNIKVHDVLISTLACLDLVHAAMNILQMALPDQFFISYPNLYCYGSHLMYHFVLLSSCFTLMEITVDRLLAVCSVLFHRIHATKKRCLMVIGATQLLSILIMSPASVTICSHGPQQLRSLTYMYIVHFTVGTSTCILMAVCYYNIWTTVHGTTTMALGDHSALGANHSRGANSTLIECKRGSSATVNTPSRVNLTKNRGGGVNAACPIQKTSAKRDYRNGSYGTVISTSTSNNGTVAGRGVGGGGGGRTSSAGTSNRDVNTTPCMRVNSHRHMNSTGSKVGIIAHHGDNQSGRRGAAAGSKTTKICVYICVVYIALTMPSITSQLLFHCVKSLKTSQTMSDIFITTYILSLFNTVSNPLVYAVLYKTFYMELQQIVHRVVKFFMCKRECDHPQSVVSYSRSNPLPKL
ncbi:uncharacterized protein LOC142338470 isoform X2 [Convolutriloba macropyga]|uniref:uncharacterized protein LOC142338470 isoform X2 n=1 Tax=Convolutriloba macropyga TaxID=536237 RepID=UPI003F51B2C6